MTPLILCLALFLCLGSDATEVRGMTISCQTWGQEWATDGFGDELDDLASLGVNWVAIHPYAGIRKDGSVRSRPLDPKDPPAWITRPIEKAHARGMSILVIPHLAQWGSGFSHRGAISFEDEAAWTRFFDEYASWIASVAEIAAHADAFCVGSELGGTSHRTAEWRTVIDGVRAKTKAHLVYSANWDEVERVPFWDAVDCIGVQAYYPLSDKPSPARFELVAAWKPILQRLELLHRRTGKPVVFTELGYNLSLDAARRPWDHRQAPETRRKSAEAIQTACLDAALSVLANDSDWLRGAFLWKWFVGPANDNFLLDTPAMRTVVRRAWKSTPDPSSTR